MNVMTKQQRGFTLEPVHPKPEEAHTMPYAPAVHIVGACDLMFLSGATPSPLYHKHPHVESEHIHPHSIEEQTTRAMEAINRYLAASRAEIGDRLGRYAVFAWLAVIALAVQGTVVLLTTALPGINDDPAPVGDIGSPEAIGRSFIDTYLVAFEATSLALLVAAMGAVMLAKRAVRSEGGR